MQSDKVYFILNIKVLCLKGISMFFPQAQEATLLDHSVSNMVTLCDQKMKQEMAIRKYKIQNTRFTHEAFIVIKREFTDGLKSLLHY